MHHLFTTAVRAECKRETTTQASSLNLVSESMISVKNWLAWLTFGCFLAFPVSGLQAHPHMFIESHVSIEFDEKGLAGFRMKWILDEMSGASFIMDYDANQDGQFSPRETAILKKEAFDNLKEYNYMSHVAIDGRAFEVEWVKDFSALIEDNKLVYHFFIPCHVTAIEQNKRIQMAVYDDAFFIDFAIEKSM